MRYSRWARSDVTFGPVGRIVATVLVCVPDAWFAFGTGGFGFYGLVLWTVVVVPWALRDIWRRVPTVPLDPLGVGDALRSGPVGGVDPATSIANRPPPARW
ncbi:MAG: hypothetical protein ACJ74O_01970 [Frankiaceae bacterium]